MAAFKRLTHFISKTYKLNNHVINAPNFSFVRKLTIPTNERIVTEDMPDPDIKNPYLKDARKCILCKYNIRVNYKNPKLLSQFVSSYTGRIYDKHITGLCDAQQKIVALEIYKSRRNGYMPITLKESKFLKDSKLFNPSRPSRPNPH